MFCIACGKTIPNDSNFCAYCGKPQAGQNGPVVWEYQDYIMTFGKGCATYQNGTDALARSWFWSCYQARILTDMQKNFDEGWQLLSEIGPAAFETRWNRGLFNDTQVPVRFVVKMRRQKKA